MTGLEVLGLCHIGFAVRDITEFQRSWGPLLGVGDWLVCDVAQPDGAMRLHGEVMGPAFSRAAFGRFGDTSLELVEPHHGETRTSEWLATHGPGIHHVCVWVPNLADALASLPDGTEVSYAPASLCATTAPTAADFWAYVEVPGAGVPWCLELMDVRAADTVRSRFGDSLTYPTALESGSVWPWPGS